MEDMMEKVNGLRLEDKGEETDSSVTKTGPNQEGEEVAGNDRSEEMITEVEDEGEIRTEKKKEICSGATLMATHSTRGTQRVIKERRSTYRNGTHSSSRENTQKMNTGA